MKKGGRKGGMKKRNGKKGMVREGKKVTERGGRYLEQSESEVSSGRRRRYVWI